uniref:Putative tick transposon n=1 Tax=Rhipicephalus microplus TaxID=6941 RepID=A0A6M2CNN5_RHIMP
MRREFPQCRMKHSKKFVDCAMAVVYMTPFSCGKVYIGQSGRCVNVRLREHDSSLKSVGASHLAAHCRECGCYPLFQDTEVVFRSKNKLTRELTEAFHIRKRGEQCVSQPSVLLHDKEFVFLDYVPR